MLYVDVAVEVIQAVPGQDGDDDAREESYGTSEENSLPLGPFDVEKTLRKMGVSCVCSGVSNIFHGFILGTEVE